MIGVVLAGGASSRFGAAPKGLALLDGKAMVLRVAGVLAQGCTHVVIEAPRNAGYEALGLPLLHAPAEHAGKGPLAGLAAGLADAPPETFVAFAPCDMPRLTREIYDMLTRACDDGAPGAYATTPKGLEPLVAVLGAGMRSQLLAALAANDLPRTHAVLDAAGARAIAFADPVRFENVNTPQDLERLQRR